MSNLVGPYNTKTVTFDELAEEIIPERMRQAGEGKSAQLLILLENGWNEREFNGLLGAFFRKKITENAAPYAGAQYADFGAKLLPFAYDYKILGLDAPTGDYLVEQYAVADENGTPLDGHKKYMDRLTLQGLSTWDPVELLASFQAADPAAFGVAVYTDILFKSERMMRPLEGASAAKLPGWFVVAGLDLRWGGMAQHGTTPRQRSEEFLAILKDTPMITLTGEIDPARYGDLFPAGRK